MWTVIVLATGVAITALMLLRERDGAHALVIVWAHVGIAAKQEVLVAIGAALAGTIAVAALIA